MSFDVTTLALAKSYTNQHGGGGGGASTTGDFIIKMTLAGGDDGHYTLASCDATIEQIDVADAAGKRVVVIASDGGISFELPMLQGAQGVLYSFGTFQNGQMITSFVQKIDESTSEWQFLITQIQAESVDYSNAALPNVANVKGALDALVPKSHTHDNKWVLDKFDEFFGKPIYDGKVLGEGVFIIKVTASMNDDGTYEVINPTSTLAEIEAAVEDRKVPIALVETSRTSTVILQLKSCDEVSCIFSTMLYGTEAQLHVVQEDQERWYFIMSSQPISADGVYYTSFGSVEAALDELVPKSHTHANKDTLDKLSDSNGKLQYNGSDVGLKGDKGDTGAAGADGYTPVKGTDYWTAADKAEIVDDTLAALPKWTGGNY